MINKVCIDSPGMDDECTLTIALKTLNYTAGPSEIVPCLLLFVVAPCLPIRPLPLPDNAVQMMALRNARNKMARITARACMENALTKNAPRAAGAIIRMSETVLWYEDKPTGC